MINVLSGYCADGDQRLLVYEYMSAGSLEDHLLGMSQFSFYIFFFTTNIIINLTLNSKIIIFIIIFQI